jgi:CopG family nickel-responsive transcriptional regulator
MGAGRITISLDEDLLAAFDADTQLRGYSNRSEAFRDLIREHLQDQTIASSDSQPVIATLTYIYDHKERALGMRLMDTQHEHHTLTLSTLHVHVTPESCLETAVLKGPQKAVRQLANRILAEPGVRYGRLHVIPTSEASPQTDEPCRAAPVTGT